MLYTYELSCHSCHLWSILLVSVTNYTALFLMWPHLVDTLPHSHAGRWHSPWCWTHPPQQAEGGWAHAMWGWDLWIPKMWWCPSTPSHRTLLFVEWGMSVLVIHGGWLCDPDLLWDILALPCVLFAGQFPLGDGCDNSFRHVWNE